MFHFDVTCEDCRLIAVGMQCGERLSVDIRLIDNHSGKQHEIENVSFCDLEKLISGMICCHGDIRAPEDYPHLEQLLDGCPPECRPIP